MKATIFPTPRKKQFKSHRFYVIFYAFNTVFLLKLVIMRNNHTKNTNYTVEYCKCIEVTHLSGKLFFVKNNNIEKTNTALHTDS